MRSNILLYSMILLLAIGAWCFYQSAFISSQGGEAPVFSDERHDLLGSAAIKDLLIERGSRVTILRHPCPDETTGATLVQVLPIPSKRKSHHDSSLHYQRLKDWISNGNTLIQFTRGQTGLMWDYKLESTAQLKDEQLDLKIEEEESKRIDNEGNPSGIANAHWIASPLPNGRTTRQMQLALDLGTPSVLKPAKDAGDAWEPLVFRPQTQDWFAAVRRVGKGRLIIVSSPSPILNSRVANAHNLEFVLDLLGAKNASAQPTNEIIFDQWVHGIGHDNTVIGFMRAIGLLPMIAQVAVVILLYVWSTAGFRPREDSPRKRNRSSAEQIETLGYLYSQSLGPNTVYLKVNTEVRRRLALALRCSPGSLEDHLRQAKPDTAQRAKTMLDVLQKIGQDPGPQCPKCGYDLTHNTTGKCSECGCELPWKIRDQIARVDAHLPIHEQNAKREKIDPRLIGVLQDAHLFLEESNRARRTIH